MPNLYLICGCNGAGKTTASYAIFPKMLNCSIFVNMDEIAAVLSPYSPDKEVINAGRIVVQRINELVKQQKDFAVETTLSTRSYAHFIRKAQKAGYFVTLVYFWLRSPEMAVKRVEKRKNLGGHSVDVDVIVRRYWTGIKNLFKIYLPISNYWILIDNSQDPFELIAEGETTKPTKIENHEKFFYLKTMGEK